MMMTQDLLTGVSISGSLQKKGDDWCTKCLSHVHNLHRILSIVFEGLDSDEDQEDVNSKLHDFPSKSESDEDGSNVSLFSLFSQHCFVLVQMFSEKTKGPVKLPLTAVMKVLRRCLKVSYADVTALPSMAELASNLASLHQSCLDVLGQLILCCKKDLLPLGRSIIDLCLQTLISAGKMDSSQKSRTKASVYQTLLLWAQTCGWGSSLNLQAKTLTQDLISNTTIMEDSLRITVDKQESSTPDVASGRRRKGKKKRFNKADSYAELGKVNDNQNTVDLSPDEVEAVVNSLLFARLAVESLPFSSSQNLIRHITDMAAAVQKKGQDRPKPYQVVEVRKRLYQAVTACAAVSLDRGCQRNDAIFHFQLTNSALHLLIAVDSSETHEVKLVCCQALKSLEMFGRMKGPVIRKALPNDDNEDEDITELTRERDRLVDDTESLRARLLESEMESEQQSRLIANLQQELNRLRIDKEQRRILSHLGDNVQSSMNPQPELADNIDANDNDDDDEQEMSEDGEGSSRDNVNKGGASREFAQETKSGVDREISVRSKTTTALDESARAGIKNSAIKDRTGEIAKKGIADDDGTYDSQSNKKRAKIAEDDKEESSMKRPRQEPQDDSVQDMLLDFVDAPPDA